MNPKKLIDLDNLEEALLLLGKMAGLKITGIKLEDAKRLLRLLRLKCLLHLLRKIRLTLQLL
jgi:hypothetical protein